MRIAICGAGEFGQYLTGRLRESDKWDIKYYVDNAINLPRSLPVISYSELKDRKDIDRLIIAVKSYHVIGDLLMQLHEEGVIIPILIAKPELWEEKPNISSEQLFDKYVYQIEIQKKAVISKLEYHVCDVCNLNCKGCSHFAPIFKNSFSDIEDFRKDMEQLTKKFSNILRLRLMGGEPFLHKGLSLFIKAAREAFPYAHLEIVTNGLLLESVGKEMFAIIRECGAVLNISLYPPTYIMKEKIENILGKEGVTYSFGSGLEQYNDAGVIEEFHKNLTLSRTHTPEMSARGCMGGRCHYLRNGKISKCALPLLVPEINRYFKTEYVVDQKDVIDIYDESVPAWEMVKRLYKATPFCGYCIAGETVRFQWEAHKQVCLADYIV